MGGGGGGGKGRVSGVGETSQGRFSQNRQMSLPSYNLSTSIQIFKVNDKIWTD